MTTRIPKSGTPKQFADFIDLSEDPKPKRSVLDSYPDSGQVLLWIGSAIAIIVGATWVMVTERVESHQHPEMAKQHDIQRLVDAQTTMQMKLDSLSVDIRNQSQTIIEIYRTWRPRQER